MILPGAARSCRCGTQLHAQGNALARYIDFQHLHFHNVTGLDDLARIGDELVAQLADVHQSVLMNTEVDEGTKRGHIADRALQHHALLQVKKLPAPQTR